MGRWITLAVLVAVFATLLTASLVRAQDDSIIISYAENGTDPVVTLEATDPEMDTITWSRASTGTEDFAIDDGVLTFQSPPDYEAPAGGSNNDTNTYVVVVTASDTALDDTFTVIVQVTNEDEPGKVTWTTDADGNNTVDDPTLVQFEVGAVLAATATDGDISGTKTVEADQSPTWRWYRGGTQISGANNASYTVTAVDVGSRLRVEVTYRVAGNTNQETASLTSDYLVLENRTGNAAPRFTSTSLAREFNEGEKGMAVGARVTATDDGPGKLNYALDGEDATKFKIDQETGQITTDVDLDYDADTTDHAANCRDANDCTVTVTATDSAGLASNPVANVTIRILNMNDEKPAFIAGSADTTADVAENTTAVNGATAYAASDGDVDQVTLSLMGADKDLFELASDTDMTPAVSQLLSFKVAPDFENPTDANGDNVYEVTVRASDGTMYADRMVRVTVTGANEAPMITGDSVINYAENGTGPVTTLTATDPEMDTIAWTVGGTDAGLFAIDDGVLTFQRPPDYEGTGTDNNHEVVVTASDTALTDTFTVIVQVTNEDEPGKVTWTTDADGNNTVDDPTLVQFEVGAVLAATATDGDISGTKTVEADQSPTWRWYRGGTQISGANNASYTVTAVDVGSRLRVEVTYRVAGNTNQETASLTSDYLVLENRTGNAAPRFTSTSLARELSEGEKGMAVGARVTATDDGPGKLNYALGTGGDNVKFKIDQETGQITTDVDLDYDADTTDQAANCAVLNDCTVTVTATDSAGLASNPVATVTIRILNMNDEKPAFTADSADTTADVAENTTAVNTAVNGATAYAASDGDGDQVTLSLMGADKDLFELASDTDMTPAVSQLLSFKAAPDFENPTDANGDNVYEVTVRASDGTMYADRMVRVTVTGANEAPMISAGLTISGPMRLSYAEGGMDAVGSYSASGPEVASPAWSLEGDDAGDLRVDGSGESVMLRFSSSPDYENPADMDGDSTYEVTLKATDGTNMATRDVTVTGDKRRPGRRGQRDRKTVSWQWSKSMTVRRNLHGTSTRQPRWPTPRWKLTKATT